MSDFDVKFEDDIRLPLILKGSKMDCHISTGWRRFTKMAFCFE